MTRAARAKKQSESLTASHTFSFALLRCCSAVLAASLIMSSLGFVKAQRVPSQISGDDEIFQKELKAIKNKLGGAGRARTHTSKHTTATAAASSPRATSVVLMCCCCLVCSRFVPAIYRAGYQPAWLAAAAAPAAAAASSSSAAAEDALRRAAAGALTSATKLQQNMKAEMQHAYVGDDRGRAQGERGGCCGVLAHCSLLSVAVCASRVLISAAVVTCIVLVAWSLLS